MTKDLLRVGIMGVGHFGRFHAQKAMACPREDLVALFDADFARATEIASQVGTRPVKRFEDLIAEVDAVIIATPAESHHALARACLLAGRHVLIEKPIAATRQEADELSALAEKNGRVLQVGHLLRYSAEHRAISERVRRPIYIEATRIAPFKPRGTDVSVILDLMIHDLDLVLALVDSPIAEVDALGAAVSSKHEDIANARVRFDNGCVATITASRISLKTERRMRIFSEEGYLSANFVDRELTFIGRNKGLVLPGTGGFRREVKKWHDADNLAAEHLAFATSCLDGARVLVDAKAGIRALDAALRVKESMDAARAQMERSGLIHTPS